MSLEERVGALLRQKSMKLALAESCTGGLIAARITSVPGASDYLEAGFVTYSNRMKELLLGVSGDVIAANGAVSRQVAARMAEGALSRAEVDVALSVTGIAGPTGGTTEKPVGTVYVALAMKGKTVVRHCLFEGTRAEIQMATSEEALRLLLDFCEGNLS